MNNAIPQTEEQHESEQRYEKPAIVFRGKLETYAVSCLKDPVGCSATTPSTS